MADPTRKAIEIAITQKFSALTLPNTFKTFKNIPYTEKQIAGVNRVHLKIIHGKGNYAGTGGLKTLVRRVGMIEINIFSPRGEGVSDATEISDILSEAFENEQFDCVTCYNDSLIPLGEIEGKYQHQWLIPFDVFRIKTI